LAKNESGYILGDFFHKRIWSPWYESKKVIPEEIAIVMGYSFVLSFVRSPLNQS
jgi:hypothetical protein